MQKQQTSLIPQLCSTQTSSPILLASVDPVSTRSFICSLLTAGAQRCAPAVCFVSTVQGGLHRDLSKEPYDLFVETRIHSGSRSEKHILISVYRIVMQWYHFLFDTDSFCDVLENSQKQEYEMNSVFLFAVCPSPAECLPPALWFRVNPNITVQREPDVSKHLLD